MEETKEQRPREAIQKEYAQYCAQLGENKFRRECLAQSDQALLTKISELNAEAQEIAKAEEKPLEAQ